MLLINKKRLLVSINFYYLRNPDKNALNQFCFRMLQTKTCVDTGFYSILNCPLPLAGTLFLLSSDIHVML